MKGSDYMQETKLIIVTGISGAGKSTTSKAISKLYTSNGIDSHWYHEEMADHPIRWAKGGEFKAGDLHTEVGMKKNIEDIFDRWHKFIDSIASVGGIHVMEGCLYQNIVRYFFDAGSSDETILSYYRQLMKILDRVDFHLVFLYPKDVEKTLKAAFETRGTRWENLIMKPSEKGYYEKNPYLGPESIYKMYIDQRDLSNRAFEAYEGKKIKLMVEGDSKSWHHNMKAVADFLDLKLYDSMNKKYKDLDLYTGRLYTDEDQPTSMGIKSLEGDLYFTTSWFKSMKMHGLDDYNFELMSFPIHIHYDLSQDKRRVKITGNYGWDANDQWFLLRDV